MHKRSLIIAAGIAGIVYAVTAAAKLPDPTPEQKEAAALAAAKAAYANSVANYQLCQSMDKAAAHYAQEQKAAGKSVAAQPTPPCTAPPPFVAPAAKKG